MNKLMVSIAFMCSFVLISTNAFADPVQEEKAAMQQEVDAKVQALLNSPPGVFDVEYQDGQLVRLKIKGEAEVPVSLQGARGDRQARERADRNARAAFSQFLNQNVTVVESDTEGFVIHEKDGKESAEYLNVSQRTMASLSNSFIRGLVVLFDQVEGEGPNRKSVVVLGWSKKLVQASSDAQDAMLPPPAAAQTSSGSTLSVPMQNQGGNTNTQTRIGNTSDF